MKRETFNLGIATLVNAFSYIADRITGEAIEIYWEDLKDVRDDKFTEGVAWCRHHLKFFPSIAELGAACFDGNEHWHEEMVKRRRALFQHKMKVLVPPMSDEERLQNRQKIAEIADSLGKRLRM